MISDGAVKVINDAVVTNHPGLMSIDFVPRFGRLYRVRAGLYRTNLLPKQKSMVSKFIRDVMPIRRKGLIRGIVSSEDSFTALIDTQAVREEDIIHDLKFVKIYADKVKFEKDGRQWTYNGVS